MQTAALGGASEPGAACQRALSTRLEPRQRESCRLASTKVFSNAQRVRRGAHALAAGRRVRANGTAQPRIRTRDDQAVELVCRRRGSWSHPRQRRTLRVEAHPGRTRCIIWPKRVWSPSCGPAFRSVPQSSAHREAATRRNIARATTSSNKVRLGESAGRRRYGSTASHGTGSAC